MWNVKFSTSNFIISNFSTMLNQHGGVILYKLLMHVIYLMNRMHMNNLGGLHFLINPLVLVTIAATPNYRLHHTPKRHILRTDTAFFHCTTVFYASITNKQSEEEFPNGRAAVEKATDDSNFIHTCMVFFYRTQNTQTHMCHFMCTWKTKIM